MRTATAKKTNGRKRVTKATVKRRSTAKRRATTRTK